VSWCDRAPHGVRLRNEGRINDEVLRRVEHELDLSEERLS